MRAIVLVAFAGLGCSPSSGGGDGGGDAGPTLAIVFSESQPTQVVPGAAVPLAVVLAQPDGTTLPLPTGTEVTWTAPPTFTAVPPGTNNAMLPSDDPAPLAFFLANPTRPDRSDYAGVLFVVKQGTTDSPNVEVTATVAGYGSVTASVPVRAPPVGDPDAGATAWVNFKCGDCHGATGAGSPLNDGGSYTLQGNPYPYPAPPLNARDGGAAADPGWNAAFFGLAGEGDIDNGGVALRPPMPDFLGKTSAEDYANIYAFMRSQTQ